MLLNIDCDNEVISTDVICQSRFSKIFAGNFRGKPVAVKRVDFERLHESIKYTSTKDALEKLHFPDCHENVLNLTHIITHLIYLTHISHEKSERMEMLTVYYELLT